MADDLRPRGWTGQPDVQGVGWVTDQPQAVVRRRRSTAYLAAGVVLLALATLAMAVSIVRLATTGGPSAEDTVAEGVVGALDGDGGEGATFTAPGSEPFTVWLRNEGFNETNRRENIVAATACDASLSNGDVADFQGNRQGTSVTIGDESTVGWFTAAEGTVEVRCEQVPFGQRRTRDWLRDEHTFLVVAGKPSAPWGDVVVLMAAVVVLLLGIGALVRWRRGKLVAT